MIGCFPIVKYLYILVLFVFAFLCWFNPALEIAGFSGVFVIQTLFTSILFLDIVNDVNRNSKTLTFSMLQNLYVLNVRTYKIPLYWILIPGALLPFISSFIMMITTTSLYRKFQKIKLARDSEWYTNIYKNLYIVLTAMLMFLLYVYVRMFNTNASTLNFHPIFRVLIAAIIVGILVIGSFEVYIASKLSTYIRSSVDG